MNTLYNTAIIETRGVRTIAGGGTNSSTVTGALSSLFVPNNISVASNTITIGTSGVGTLNVSTSGSGTINVGTSATGTINVGTSGSGTINVGISGAGRVNALGVASQFGFLENNYPAIGPALTNFGLPTVSLAAGGIYELVYDVVYLKNTAGTIVYTLSGSRTFTSVNGSYVQTPVAGGTAVGGFPSTATNAIIAGFANLFTSSVALPNTGSLTANAYHRATITYMIRTVTAATNALLAVTNSAGTITPIVNSYYKLTRIGTGT
jgi:hypothetical protein